MSEITIYHIIFFTNVRKKLDECGMAQKELSQKASISSSFLSDLINGRANPSLTKLAHIADALEVPLSQLLTSTDINSSSVNEIAERSSKIPDGYKEISVVVPEYVADVIKKKY